LPALELALESKFRESRDSPMSFELSWKPGGSVRFLINLFGFFELTMVVVRGREVFCPRVVVGFLILASQSHYVLGQLEPSLTMLLLGSIDSGFSLQSAPSVRVAIARWKHVDTSLQTAPGLLTVP